MRQINGKLIKTNIYINTFLYYFIANLFLVIIWFILFFFLRSVFFNLSFWKMEINAQNIIAIASAIFLCLVNPILIVFYKINGSITLRSLFWILSIYYILLIPIVFIYLIK